MIRDKQRELQQELCHWEEMELMNELISDSRVNLVKEKENFPGKQNDI